MQAIVQVINPVQVVEHALAEGEGLAVSGSRPRARRAGSGGAARRADRAPVCAREHRQGEAERGLEAASVALRLRAPGGELGVDLDPRAEQDHVDLERGQPEDRAHHVRGGGRRERRGRLVPRARERVEPRLDLGRGAVALGVEAEPLAEERERGPEVALVARPSRAGRCSWSVYPRPRAGSSASPVTGR